MKPDYKLVAKAKYIHLTADLAAELWQECYKKFYPPKQLAALIDKLQSADAIEADIDDGVNYFVVQLGGKPVGYFAWKMENTALHLLHLYLLPAYRGAAPIARAIIGGERETGVTIMKTDAGLDTGDMFLRGSLPVAETDTCGTLTEKLSVLGAKLIVEAVARIVRGEAVLEKQGEGSVCKKVARTPVDFTRPAAEVSALIRGLSPAPLAYAVCGGLSVNCYNACVVPLPEGAPAGMVVACSPKQGLIVACGEGAVRITELQPAGGKRMADTTFANGGKLREGARFDQPVL